MGSGSGARTLDDLGGWETGLRATQKKLSGVVFKECGGFFCVANGAMGVDGAAD